MLRHMTTVLASIHWYVYVFSLGPFKVDIGNSVKMHERLTYRKTPQIEDEPKTEKYNSSRFSLQ